MPIAAVPALYCSVSAPVPAWREMIWIDASSTGSSGCGAAVWKRMVRGSTTSTRVMARISPEKVPGELRTVGTRSIVKATSSAVRSRPSCHFTPARRRNSHSVGSTARQDSASIGRSRACASVSTSRSNMCWVRLMLGEAL